MQIILQPVAGALPALTEVLQSGATIGVRRCEAVDCPAVRPKLRNRLNAPPPRPAVHLSQYLQTTQFSTVLSDLLNTVEGGAHATHGFPNTPLPSPCWRVLVLG